MLWHSVEKSEWDFKRQRTLFSEKGLPEDEWSSTSVCYKARLYPARSGTEEFKTLKMQIACQNPRCLSIWKRGRFDLQIITFRRFKKHYVIANIETLVGINSAQIVFLALTFPNHLTRMINDIGPTFI